MIPRTDEIRLRLLKEGRDPYVVIEELEDELRRWESGEHFCECFECLIRRASDGAAA